MCYAEISFFNVDVFSCAFFALEYAFCGSRCIATDTSEKLKSLGRQNKSPEPLWLRAFDLVEAGGVEPPSENTSSGTSPGADGCLHSRAMTQAVMLHGLVASLVMPGAKLTPVTCTTQIMPKPGSWSFRGGQPLIKQRRELRYRCSLIYKLPVFRMTGASARYSRTHVPVETSTPPDRLLEWGRQVGSCLWDTCVRRRWPRRTEAPHSKSGDAAAARALRAHLRLRGVFSPAKSAKIHTRFYLAFCGRPNSARQGGGPLAPQELGWCVGRVCF